MILYLALGTFFMLVELGMAFRDGYAFAWQVRALPIVPGKFLDFARHGGMWGDFFIINPIIAYLLSKHSNSWNPLMFGVILTICGVVGAFLLVPLLDDSRTTPSAFARDGLLTVVGAMHYIYFAIATTICTVFFLFTPKAEVSKHEIIIVTASLMIHWTLGVLQPPWLVHGSIHLPAAIITVSGWVALFLFSARFLSAF